MPGVSWIFSLTANRQPARIAESGRSIELKARDADPARSVDACESLGIEDRGVLTQRDTYFNASHRRLKLREEEGAKPHLVACERPKCGGPRKPVVGIIDMSQCQQPRLD